jgi:hypothetical protein
MSFSDFDDDYNYDFDSGWTGGPIDSVTEAICPLIEQMPFGLCNLPLLIGGAIIILMSV